MLGAPRHHLLPCAKSLPRLPLPQTACHKTALHPPMHQPASGGRGEWQISLKQSQAGFRTLTEEALQLIFVELHGACWDWFASVWLVCSSAVTMAWHMAKRLVTLITVRSYVRVLLTGWINDTSTNAVGLGLRWQSEIWLELLSFVYMVCKF